MHVRAIFQPDGVRPKRISSKKGKLDQQIKLKTSTEIRSELLMVKAPESVAKL